MKEKKKVLFTALVAVLLFLNVTGFISHLTGDYSPQMTLDNAGLYYDSYYVHKSDVIAILWLANNNVNHELVESNASDMDKLLTYGDISALYEIFPPLIRKDAYVYLETSTGSVFFNSDYFNSPKPFLDDNKNLIYSNGEIGIYK